MARLSVAAIIAVVVLAALTNCTGTIKLSSSERDDALAFYKQLYPISAELKQTLSDWNSWSARASSKDYRDSLSSKSREYEAALRILANRLGVLRAPPGLSDLKSQTLSAINKGIESFSLAQEYARTPYDESYRLKAEAAQLEVNWYLSLAADKWDDGLTKYGIKPAEIIR